MDTEMKFYKSLPPLVEGKIHGHLKLVIDEVVWVNKSPGEVRVLAIWWGESDSSQFRPIDIAKNFTKSEHQTIEVYAIRTNLNLFEEYVKNCESIELTVISEETNTVIGTSEITNILDIFDFKSCFKYIPIISDSGNRIGELHISMKLEHVTKSLNMQLKSHKYEKQQGVDNTVHPVDSFRSQKDIKNDICQNLKSEENDIYKSILKSKRTAFQEPLKKFNNEVADNLVAQVVARAQRLRGAILKETLTNDLVGYSDNANDGLHAHILPEDETRLYEYFLGKDMTYCEERKVLSTLRSISPTLNANDLASNTFTTCKVDTKKTSPSNTLHTLTNSSVDEALTEEKRYINSKDMQLLNHVDCIRIFVESFNLSPAGYRRVKSSSLLNNDNAAVSATYFVQYDITFDHTKETRINSVKENKPIRICSKKQTNEVIYFNYDGMHGVSKLKPLLDYVIKFKIFVRHLNKKSLTELGTGTVHVNDIIKTENWSIAQRLTIANKGIKVGELSVIIELGSDSIHFGKEYIDGLMSAKQHIPILETQQLLSEDKNRNKSAAGPQSKTSSQVSSASAKEINCLTTGSDLLTTRDISRQWTENVDDKGVDVKSQENNVENKVLLHGLIYVAEGKELPELNTYLICRAFWREDKSRSQICNNTKNPFYQFCQLVPLIYGVDLLDRIKDNYIIIEVYCRNNNTDNLLGLAKLPVHQLYVAYRDPRVLPHLLLSKYPIVSVDGWVPIVNPVTGQSCGQLLALVALGTAEQITLLEVSRGLRNTSAIPQTISSPESLSGCRNPTQNVQHCTKHNLFELPSNVETFSHEESQFYGINTAERESRCSNLKSQESQTDISTVKKMKFSKDVEEPNAEHAVLHNLVGRLTQVLDGNRANAHQAAQTDIHLEENKRMDVEEQMCINELNFNNNSDDSDSSSIRHNFHLPTEMYRSVGVGAEYDEEQPTANYSNPTFDLPSVIHTEKESTESTLDQSTFRVVIEIECALHLPKTEEAHETIEPSTYVSFQASKCDPSKQLNSYTITNVFPRSCNPKWNWKYETKLPTELLLHDEKRLILKIWRLSDADVSMQVDLERDIVIGFSAIDLSVLMNGFPTVSGWFHIMDFTGKCNGQIKISITPLDNLTLFGKPPSTLNTTRLPMCNVSQLGCFPSQNHEMQPVDIERNNVHYTLTTPTEEDDKSVHSENELNDCVPHVGLEDMSMSFLSFSLKQKLTELDEITKRLQSRLRDVTNAAFDDVFENEFDLNEPGSDTENNDFNNSDAVSSNYVSRICQAPQVENKLQHHNDIMGNENQNASNEREPQNHNYGVINLNGSPKTSCSYSKQSGNYQTQYQNVNFTQNLETLDNVADYPERGTKTHINYLLDKLSLQLSPQSCSVKTMPIRKDIMGLLTNLHQNNNNMRDSNKCSQEVKVCTVPTQTDNTDEQSTEDSENSTANCLDKNQEISTQSKLQIPNRMSAVIREELVAEENSDSPKYDELTTYLITSNVRHMHLNNIFNPLLYQHLVPDVQCSNTTSPEEEAIEQLDYRYSKAFSTSIGNRLSKVQTLMEVGTAVPENGEIFRMTPSGVSENVDDNIDLTVLRKSSYNDLLACSSTDSTTTISPKKLSKATDDAETTENSYSTSFETSAPVLSRQAPDGGNPVEDVTKQIPVNLQQEDETQDSSSSSCN